MPDRKSFRLKHSSGVVLADGVIKSMLTITGGPPPGGMNTPGYLPPVLSHELGTVIEKSVSCENSEVDSRRGTGLLYSIQQDSGQHICMVPQF